MRIGGFPELRSKMANKLLLKSTAGLYVEVFSFIRLANTSGKRTAP